MRRRSRVLYGGLAFAAALLAGAFFAQGFFEPSPPDGPTPDVTDHVALGCWQLQRTPGSDELIPNLRWVRLSSVPWRPQDEETWLRGEVDTVLNPRLARFQTAWKPYPEPDRIYLVWSIGIGGGSGRFTVDEEGMSGWVWKETDVGGPWLGGRASWRRVPCVQ